MGEQDMKAEITFDLVMDDDMPFVEGCYRLPDGPWQVFIFIGFRDSETLKVKTDAVWIVESAARS